jgi:hypothetical protein
MRRDRTTLIEDVKHAVLVAPFVFMMGLATIYGLGLWPETETYSQEASQ